jgi:cysteine synthase A
MAARDAVVVRVFCDDSKKHLSTGLMHAEPVKPEYKTPEIALLSVGIVGHACEFCH